MLKTIPTPMTSRRMYLATIFIACTLLSVAQNVGIGTNSPYAKLHVSGELGNLLRITSTSEWASIDLDSKNGDAAFRFLHNQAYTWNIRNNKADDRLEIIEKSQQGKERLVILPESGNVGIGTTAPSTRLQVAGTISAYGIRVGGGSVISTFRSGTHVAGTSASGQLITTINFPQAFAASPHLVATVRHDPNWNVNDVFAVTVKSISATQAVLIIKRLDANVAWNQNLLVDYIAIQ